MKAEHFWDRLSLLMEEGGENQSGLAAKLFGEKSRDTIRQIGLRHKQKPGAAAHGKTLDALARHFDVSVRWLLNGGQDRGTYRPLEDDLASAAVKVGVRREIVDKVLREHPDATDALPLVQHMLALESLARAGASDAQGRKKAR